MKTPWYITGLHFDCQQCGGCCSGPGEGYIWLISAEIKFIADYLSESIEQVRQKYLKRIGTRTSIIEEAVSKDCIFAKEIDGQKKCAIYPVRPNQCRTWPFWAVNLQSASRWNHATGDCPGINRGRLYSFEEIEKIRKQKQWWQG